MPIFEYQCQACQAGFEVLLKSSSGPKPECPHCGSKEVKKQLSGFAVGQSKAPSLACDACPSGGQCPSVGQGCGGHCPMG